MQTVLRTCRRLSMRIGCYNAAATGVAPRPYLPSGGETSIAGAREEGPDVCSQMEDVPPVTQTQPDEAVSNFRVGAAKIRLYEIT